MKSIMITAGTPLARLGALRLATLLMGLSGLAAHAQVVIAGGGGVQSLPGATAGNSNDSTGGATSGVSGGGVYNPGGGSVQAAAPIVGYSPLTIASPNNQNLTTDNAIQVTRPQSEENLQKPLYARPTQTPGQFELFRRPTPERNEFEKYIDLTLGRPLQRFGSSLVLNGGRGFAVGPSTTVPPDYALNPGDELLIGITGSVEADLRLVIDSEGRIFVPRIGAINVAGVRYGDLTARLNRRFSEQYKQVRVSVVVSHLHGLTVYVTGHAVSPGAYTVSSLSTMVDAVLAAGGPGGDGSFRSVELRRNGRLITTLDMYDLLLRGDRSRDVILQNEDVLNIAPTGPELAVTGSVNQPAIYEAEPGDTLADVLRYAGGLNSLADDSRIIIRRLGDMDSSGSEQVRMAMAGALPAERGEIVEILSLGGISRPLERQAILATIEGEVDHPGRYYLPPGATVADVLAKAGGLTSGAYVFGAELDRETVRRQQRMSFLRAIDDLELAATASSVNVLSGGGEGAANSGPRLQAALAVIDKLRDRTPDGRLVLNLSADAKTLPTTLTLENNDHIYIPPRPTTVGVFGAAYRPGSFLYGSADRLGGYIKLAGGAEKYADKGDIFVVRANGSVLSRQVRKDFDRLAAVPGDVIFIPVRTSKTALQKLVEAASVIFQFGVSAASIRYLTS